MARRMLAAVVLISPLLAAVAYDYRAVLRAWLGGVRRPVGSRRGEWARPIAAPPLENFYRVSEDLYRGAQPDRAGMLRLKALGVRTVVSLRRRHDDAPLAAGTGLRTVAIRVNPGKPSVGQVLAFLRIATDGDCVPVYVHCQRGIDRTGMMCAAYRMVVCGWSHTDAIAEMVHGPFGYDGIFANVPEFLAALDVEALRRALRRPVHEPRAPAATESRRDPR